MAALPALTCETTPLFEDLSNELMPLRLSSKKIIDAIENIHFYRRGRTPHNEIYLVHGEGRPKPSPRAERQSCQAAGARFSAVSRLGAQLFEAEMEQR